MDISVTDFKARCLDLIRQVESNGNAVTIRRRGRVVARLESAGGPASQLKPWEELRRLGGESVASSEESVMADDDFEAQR
jgi:antitoxin (DNA-binding transcriptional repressor) of toxin-antitoxin stability system